MFKSGLKSGAQFSVGGINFQLSLAVRKPQAAGRRQLFFKWIVNESGQHVVVFRKPGNVPACFRVYATTIGDQADQAIVPGQEADKQDNYAGCLSIIGVAISVGF